jgi:hypothetical protein
MRSFPVLLSTVFAVTLFASGCGNASHADPFKTAGNFTPPAIASLTPNSIPVNSVSFTLVVNGSNFGTDSVAFWQGTPRFTRVVNSTTLQVALTQTDLSYAGLVPIYVRTQGLNSNTVDFDVAIQ